MKIIYRLLNILIAIIDKLFKYDNNLKKRIKRNLLFFKSKIIIVTSSINWSAQWDGIYISECLKKLGLIDIEIAIPRFAKNKIVHWIAIVYIIELGLSYLKRSNINIANWYHVEYNDERLKYIPFFNKYLDLLITSSDITKNMLIKEGFDENKIEIIPLGVDLSIFKPYDKKRIIALKKKYNLPMDKIIIGSFQKDGSGWGEGLIPKMVKGPDIFCEVVRRLNKIFDIHIFLTGPARGFVKEKLKEYGISFTHVFLDDYLDIINCYNTLDLYIVTSRREGAPKALLESMATGIPIVTTNVGMAPYLIKHGVNGLKTEVDDIEKLVEYAKELIQNEGLRRELVKNGFKIIKNYTWENVAKEYYQKAYKKYVSRL